VPTTLLSVALYVFALFPGVAFGFARDGHRPAGKRSAIRETASVVFISTICNGLVAVVIAVIATRVPPVQKELEKVLLGDLSWVREHLLPSVLLLMVAIAASTALGYALGSKTAAKWGLNKLWNSGIQRDLSAWQDLFEPDEPVTVQVGATLKSGTWIAGTLYTFDPNPDADPHRTIVLSGELVSRPQGATTAAPIDAQWVVIEAQDIELLMVSYEEPDPQTEVVDPTQTAT